MRVRSGEYLGSISSLGGDQIISVGKLDDRLDVGPGNRQESLVPEGGVANSVGIDAEDTKCLRRPIWPEPISRSARNEQRAISRLADPDSIKFSREREQPVRVEPSGKSEAVVVRNRRRSRSGDRIDRVRRSPLRLETLRPPTARRAKKDGGQKSASESHEAEP